MENLRRLLHQYRPTTAFFFGERLVLNFPYLREGYMSGAGYILSRKALIKFAQNITNAPKTDEFFQDGPSEDVNMGRMLSHSAIFADTRDELLRKTFFPSPFFTDYVHASKFNGTSSVYLGYYYPFTPGINCCSDLPILFHYVKNKTMHFLEFLIYHSHPYGMKKNLTESLPRKLGLEEIINASDAESASKNFRNHSDFHFMDSSEVF